MKKIVLTFGLISGVILSGLMVVAMVFHDAIGFDKGMVVGYTTMLVSFLLIFFGVRSYRDNVGGGRVGFLRALAVGTLIGCIASACYVATWEAYYFGTHSDYLEKYSAHILEKERQAGASEAVIAAKQAEMKQLAEMYRNPLINSAMTFMEPLPVAIVVALVSAGILSRRKKPGLQPASEAQMAPPTT